MVSGLQILFFFAFFLKFTCFSANVNLITIDFFRKKCIFTIIKPKTHRKGRFL